MTGAAAELLAACRENVREDTPRCMLADELELSDEPAERAWAEFIRVQLRLACERVPSALVRTNWRQRPERPPQVLTAAFEGDVRPGPVDLRFWLRNPRPGDFCVAPDSHMVGVNTFQFGTFEPNWAEPAEGSRAWTVRRETELVLKHGFEWIGGTPGQSPALTTWQGQVLFERGLPAVATNFRWRDAASFCRAWPARLVELRRLTEADNSDVTRLNMGGNRYALPGGAHWYADQIVKAAPAARPFVPTSPSERLVIGLLSLEFPNTAFTWST